MADDLRVVIAPDSFKGTISAPDAAAAIARGWAKARPEDHLALLPMADGGEGTADVCRVAFPEAEERLTRVVGPDGRQHDAPWLLLPDGMAFVELASASGIELLGERRLPLDAHTLGFGQAIAAALDAGAKRILLGIGSSASTDGGSGLLRGLGARLLDADGKEIALGLRGLADLAAVDLSGLRGLPQEGVLVLSDVDNPLLGPDGAARVFGPQKGLDVAGIQLADVGLGRLAELLGVDPQQPGAGAAGGTGYALAAWGAELGGGADEVATAIGLPQEISAADLVITGEGSYDAQTERGKVPAHVAGLARAAGVPVVLVAGRIEAEAPGFLASVALADAAGSPEAAMADPGRWLEEVAEALAYDAAHGF